jgi:hypothetical protein
VIFSEILSILLRVLISHISYLISHISYLFCTTGTEVHLPPPPPTTTHVTFVSPQFRLEGRTEETKLEERPAGK